MKQIYLFVITLIILLSFSDSVLGQNEKIKNGIWFTPTKAKKINGIAIGLIESEFFSWNNKNFSQTINGLTIYLVGTGIVLPIGPCGITYAFFNEEKLNNNDSLIEIFDDLYDDEVSIKHNGVVISTTGITNCSINGLLVSFCGAGIYNGNGCILNLLLNETVLFNGLVAGLFNDSYSLKGVQLGLFNDAVKIKGVQIGLINKSVKQNGLQIGLYNKTSKNAFPLFNYSKEKF